MPQPTSSAPMRGAIRFRMREPRWVATFTKVGAAFHLPGLCIESNAGRKAVRNADRQRSSDPKKSPSDIWELTLGAVLLVFLMWTVCQFCQRSLDKSLDLAWIDPPPVSLVESTGLARRMFDRDTVRLVSAMLVELADAALNLEKLRSADEREFLLGKLRVLVRSLVEHWAYEPKVSSD